MAWKPGDDCPDIVHETCGELQQVQNPPRCERVEDLGPAREKWLPKKRQYEMFTDRNGRPCQASDDTLVAAMFRLMPKSLEESVMFANEDEGFQELYDRLLAYSSTKQSIQMSENKATRMYDPMDVDALSKGKSKGKARRGAIVIHGTTAPATAGTQDDWESWDHGPYKGRGKKGQNHMSSARCWNCGKTGQGHYARNCSEMWWLRGKGKGKARGYEHADGWTWSEVHVDGLWKTSDWEKGTGSGWCTTATDWTPWNHKKQWAELSSTALKNAEKREPQKV